MNFFALDVETSNSDRGSICQIGWVEFKDGQIIDEFESLINPKDPFHFASSFITLIASSHLVSDCGQC